MSSLYSYFLLYKPYGMLCQFKPEGEKPALSSLFKFPLDCYPIGRLDTDSEGLLLLTNDKKINQKLLDPKTGYKRTYFVQVDGEITDEAIQKLALGVELKVEGKLFKTLPSLVEKISEPTLPVRIPSVRFRKSIPTSWISITLAELKNRQVRLMAAAVGFPALRIVHSKMGKIEIGTMVSGDVIEMKSSEVYDQLF